MEMACFKLIASILLAGLCGVQSHHEECSGYVTEHRVSEYEKDFNFIRKPAFPIKMTFSYSVSNITSSSAEPKMLKPDLWLLEMSGSQDENSSITTEPLNFRAFHNGSGVRILQIDAKGQTVCESIENVRNRCGLTGTLDLSAEKILHHKATWDSGRNYQITIPSKPTFVGYVIDVFFTNPVTGITAGNPHIQIREFSPTHWAFVRDWTEQACVKLLDIFFTISYKNTSDVETILLNGNYVYPISGHGKHSQAVFKNKNLSNATKTDCNSFFLKRGHPWFGTEIGKPSWFEAQLEPRSQVGLVVDVIFEKKIKHFTVWRLRSEEIKGNYWRVSNAGWVIPPDGKVRFSFQVIYFDHYYVEPVGIKVNNEVLCGLASMPEFLLQDAPVTDNDTPVKKKIYLQILLSIIFVALAILLSVIIFGVLLIKRMKATYKARQHLYNYTQHQQPVDPDQTYLSVISDSASVDDTSACVSHM